MSLVSKTIRLIVGLGALCTLTAQAYEPPLRPETWFFSGAFGTGDIRVKGGEIEKDTIELSNITTQEDNTSTSFTVGGWLDPHIGLEMGWHSVGDVQARFDYVQAQPGQIESGSGISEISTNSFSVGAVLRATIPATDDWYVTARFGIQKYSLYYYTRFDLSNGTRQRRAFNESGESPYVGVGIGYTLNRLWDVRFQYENFDLDSARATMMSFSFVWHPR